MTLFFHASHVRFHVEVAAPLTPFSSAAIYHSGEFIYHAGEITYHAGEITYHAGEVTYLADVAACIHSAEPPSTIFFQAGDNICLFLTYFFHTPDVSFDI